MKNKQFTLLAFGILASLFLIGMTSAVMNYGLTGSDVSKSITDETSSVNFLVNLSASSSGQNITSWEMLSFVNSNLTTSDINFVFPELYNLSENENKVFTLTLNGINSKFIGKTTFNMRANSVTQSGGTPASQPIFTLTLTVTETNQPEDVSSCKSMGDPTSNLKIKIDEINVDGFGDEDKIYPYDEVSVDVNVENKDLDKIKSIELSWGLYDIENDEFIVDDEEAKFTLDDGDDKTITIKFKFDDLDALEENSDSDNYKLYVWATGTVDDEKSAYDSDKICASASEVIEIATEDFVLLNNLAVPESVNCGSQFELVADAYNIGSDTLDEVTVTIYNKELGINQDVTLGDIDAYENAKLDVMLNVPENADEKNYTLQVKVYDEDGEVFENDDNDEAEFLVTLPVSGMCQINANTELTASLQSGGKAGEDMAVKVSIKNAGKKTMTFTLNPTGYTDWATSATLSQTSVTLKSGETKDVLVTLATKKSVSGDKTFDVDVLVGNQLVMEQPVTVKLAKSGFSLTDVQGSNQTLIMALVTLILIVAIITVAVRVSRK